MNSEQRQQFEYFLDCVAEAPPGCYDDAKEIRELIGATVDALTTELRGKGLTASGGDPAFSLEAEIYSYIKESNPSANLFAVAEGFGYAITRHVGMQ